MNTKIYLYIAVCAGVSFLIRELPLTLIRRPIRNRFLRSFLFYVPYVTLAVMTFPSILHTTSSPIAGLAALVLGIAAAWLGANLFQVAVGCCASIDLEFSWSEDTKPPLPQTGEGFFRIQRSRLQLRRSISQAAAARGCRPARPHRRRGSAA